jgi:acyl-CoA dehydrogenase
VIDPYLEDRHRALAARVKAFGQEQLRTASDEPVDVDRRTRELALALAEAGILGAAVPPPHGFLDLRSLVAAREGLAYFSGLADRAFGAQGFAAYPIAVAGSDVQRQRWLPEIAAGRILCACALTEPEAGSDLDGVRMRAQKDGALWKLEGVKTLIANASAAGLFTVLARSGDDGPRGLSTFLVDAEAPGLSVKPLATSAEWGLGEVRFSGTPAVLLGEEGRGREIAVATLDLFRPALGAAACGLAARALDEAVRFALGRRQFGRPLSELPAVQMTLAGMHAELSAARLLVRQAAWVRDRGAPRIALEGATAKLAATEAAQRIVDAAVQVHGGQGLLRGATVERLYREVRALRIEHGASEVLKLAMAREMLKDAGR